MQALNRLSISRIFGALALTLSLSSCAADSTEPDPALEESSAALSLLEPIPASLLVPAGTRLAFVLEGVGVQIYACTQSADGSYAWSFVEPEAKLYGLFTRPGHHYAGPTWEAADGSTVKGARVAGETVATSAIPWLLLKASGNAGTGRMSKVSYVQRLYTVGGLAPSSGCDAEHLATTVDIDYLATYAFYR